MSAESITWLNQNTLIGFTDKRGHAWHYDEAEQGAEGNHYAGAVPIEDIRRRLFHWRAVEGIITARAILPNGEEIVYEDADRKAIMRSDTGRILGVFKDSYQIHQYEEWLLQTVASLIDDELDIGSAGLLRGGAQAWVSIEIPENIKTPEGVEFRPRLIACTSHDGTLATTYQRCVTNVVCDNTMSAALSEGKDQRIKVKHSRYSSLKLQDARDALAIVHDISDSFSAEVAELCATTVTDAQWEAFLESIAPTKDGEGKDLPEGRGLTMAENKQATLRSLYNGDERVAPWKGSAWGVVQAVNTYVHHEAIVRGASQAERNHERAVKGKVDDLDRGTLANLQAVLA